MHTTLGTSSPQHAVAATPPAMTSRLAHWWQRDILLKIAFAVSLTLHGLLFAVHFRLPETAKPPKRDNGLEVVLVNARHSKAPDKAEVLAQANLDGGGNTEQAVRARTPLPPQPTRQQGDALLDAKRRAEAVSPRPQTLTAARSAVALPTAPAQEAAPEPSHPQTGLDLLDSAAAMARLEAQIERDLQEYARRPRRKSIGARAKEYRYAQYVEDWRQKIERIGTLNYPEAARGKLYGSLMVTVIIRADGQVEAVDIVRSSGHAILDDAARRIIQLASPFAPFPPDIRADTDLLEITRTWTFTRADQMRAN